ncbi:MAG: cell division protein FtsI/penicillin-binding protein 2 [Cellvibrionaceae bacterium]|jgi:cell division protein FtsI/penicillin-binding protein 2
MELQQRNRLIIVLGLIGMLTAVILVRLVMFQIIEAEEWGNQNSHQYTQQSNPQRGNIVDRNGNILASNGFDYQINVQVQQPVTPARAEHLFGLAGELALILNQDGDGLDVTAFEIREQLNMTRTNVLLPYRLSHDQAIAVDALTTREVDPYFGVVTTELPRRIYPQDDLMCHALGYTSLASQYSEYAGTNGLEEKFNIEMAGQARSSQAHISPLIQKDTAIAIDGYDLELTIDRTIQHTVETHLANSMSYYGAHSGTVIVMNPRTGAILAMANLPCYSPFEYYESANVKQPESKNIPIFANPSISMPYEPGSVMKLVTMAIALDSETVTPQSTYLDEGVLVIDGNSIYNSSRGSYGTMAMRDIINYSLNIGVSKLALGVGPETYYTYMQRFGFGQRTGIDLENESTGRMQFPGDELWTEVVLATNSFGQGVTTTPLQMISAIAAIANDGVLMRPYIVERIMNGNEVVSDPEPFVQSQAISAATAHEVRQMAIYAINNQINVASIPGYTVAGKTGTSQIPEEGGFYHPTETIASFVGWLPADDPELVILYKLDRPTRSEWGSETAAPAFADLASQLVVLLDIPPDSVRLAQK